MTKDPIIEGHEEIAGGKPTKSDAAIMAEHRKRLRKLAYKRGNKQDRRGYVWHQSPLPGRGIEFNARTITIPFFCVGTPGMTSAEFKDTLQAIEQARAAQQGGKT
jgi:hypothetical protein